MRRDPSSAGFDSTAVHWPGIRCHYQSGQMPPSHGITHTLLQHYYCRLPLKLDPSLYVLYQSVDTERLYSPRPLTALDGRLFDSLPSDALPYFIFLIFILFSFFSFPLPFILL